MLFLVRLFTAFEVTFCSVDPTIQVIEIAQRVFGTVALFSVELEI